MNYRTLMKKISKMNDEQLDSPVTIYDSSQTEFIEVIDFKIDNIDEDENPFLVI